MEKIKNNRLIADDVLLNADDNSAVYLNPSKIEELNFFRGDTVLVKGKRRKDTVCIIMADESCEIEKIRLNKTVRSNLNIKIGDIATIHQFTNPFINSFLHSFIHSSIHRLIDSSIN